MRQPSSALEWRKELATTGLPWCSHSTALGGSQVQANEPWWTGFGLHLRIMLYPTAVEVW
jgi:hypothetical protein